MPKREIFAQTGLQFMEFNTLFQLLAFQRSNPELLAAADRLLLMPDFFHWCLCGSRVIEFTNATTTQCFHAIDQRNGPSTCSANSACPRHVSRRRRAGDAARQTPRRTSPPAPGLKRIEVVAPATHDTGSAVAAVPTQSTGTPNWAYISSGTWSLMGVEVQQAVLSERALELNVTNEGGIDGTYRLLKNIMGLWLVQECQPILRAAAGRITTMPS